MYLFYLNSNRYYEFLVGKEQTLTARIDTTTGAKGFDIGGAPQTDAFIALGKFMAGKRKEQEMLVEKMKTKDSLQAKETMEMLDSEVVAHQKQVAAQNQGEIVGLFINALQQPSFPPELQNGDMQDKDFLMRRYQYAKNHYWDNYNLSDRRSWRLNTLNQRLDDFLQKILIQIPDSIAPEAVKLVEKSRGGDSITFQLMLNYMINYPLQSKVMGMDKVFVELADRYYLSGVATWADSTTLANVKSEAEKVRRNLIGMTAHNMPMETYSGKKMMLNDVKTPYTLVIFYEPSCGHCRETLPKVRDVYKKYKQQGFEVVAFYLMTDRKEWQEFLDKHSLHDWINVWDPTRQSFYWYYFDTSTTPGVYLLDKDKKIIAKKVDAESLDKILNFELNKKDEEQK